MNRIWAGFGRLSSAASVKKPTPREGLRKLSICMISDDFLPATTGVGVHVQCISKELAQRGHRVSVITSRRRGEPEFETWNGVRIYRTFTVKVYGYYQALPGCAAIRRIFDQEMPDVVHYHYLGFLLKRARKVADQFGVKNVYTCHMTAELLTQPLPMRPFRPLIERQITSFCNSCDLVLAPSRNLALQLAGKGITTRSVCISNPIEFDDNRDSAQPEQKRGFTVLYVGRLAPEKNVSYLIRGFAEFAARRQDAELWIAGDGEQRNQLERLAVALHIAGRVKFLGFVPHAGLAAYYSAADVFVLPSLFENQPIVALEAMRFGLPVLMSSSIVSSRELVDEGRNGFLLDLDSTSDLSGKLELLSGDELLCVKMGYNGRKKTEDYSPMKVVSQIESHYTKLALPVVARSDMEALEVFERVDLQEVP